MRITNKKWEMKECIYKNQAIIEEISENVGLSYMMSKIIANRGFEDLEEIIKFLNLDFKNFYDPFLMKDMRKATERIIKAIDSKEKIIIFGDYDVDGITSTSILLRYLKEFTDNCDYYIPDRIEEGYGLSDISIENVIAMKPNLIITVDCGITANEEINYITSKEIDVIITDHHECKGNVPTASAVINPKQLDCNYPFKELAGVGVVFKLLQALSSVMNEENTIEKFIEIVALGTIADVVPLIDENRIIVKYGLEKLQNTNNYGIQSLINLSGLSNKQITTISVGYILAPRINAAGRIGNASRGVDLFMADNIETADKIALELDINNKHRQQTENEILNMALDMIDQDEEILKQKVIVLASENWHHGVIGIVSSRITEKYNKPSILISIEEDCAKGSGRSIPGFNIFEALMNCSDIIDKFGGHELAVGLSIKNNNIEEFRTKINQYADKVLSDEDLIPKIIADGEITKNNLTFSFLCELKQLEPFGIANPSPVFIYSNLKIVDCKTVGDGKHLKLRVEDEGFYIDCIGFNIGNLMPDIDIFDKVDIVGSLEINKWNGNEKLQLNIKDIRTNFDIIFKEKYFDTLESVISNDLDISDLSDQALKGFKNYNGDFLSLVKNDDKNLILINTLKGAINFINNFNKLENKYKKSFNIYYNNCIQDNKRNIVVINPNLSEIDITNYDNILIYDLFFNKKQYSYLMSNNKNVFVFNEFKNYSNNLDVFNEIIPDRDELIKVYQYIRSRNVNNIFEGNIFSITRDISTSYNIDVNSFKIKKIFEIFQEMNLIKLEIDDEYYKIKINLQLQNKINIMDSKGLLQLVELKDEFNYFVDYLKEKEIC